MLRILFSLILAFAISSCTAMEPKLSEDKSSQCKPSSLFKSNFAKVTLSGVVIFSDNVSDYYYNMSKNNWNCSAPNSQVINEFKSESSSQLLLAIQDQKNNTQDILEIRLNMNANKNFKSFVSEQCSSQGLSYLFEVRGASNEKVYGCQINPNISSAIMWKQTAEKPFIDLAYLPFYQPFVNKIITLN